MAGLPTLGELLQALSFLGQEPAALGIMLTAILLVIARDWRWSLTALIVQYVLAGWLLTQVLEPRVAVLKILMGMIVCLVLYLTARQVRWGQPAAVSSPPEPAAPLEPGSEPLPDSAPNAPSLSGRRTLPTSVWFRLLVGVLAATLILFATSSGSLVLPQLPPHVNLAAVSLMALGLLALGLTDEPLTAGMGLLTLLTGFELFYHSLEQAITVIGFLIGVDFVVALVTAYLTVACHLEPGQAERRRPT